MHVDQFNEEFAPPAIGRSDVTFYADFRYYGSVQLPEYIRQETLAANMLTLPDDAIAILSISKLNAFLYGTGTLYKSVTSIVLKLSTTRRFFLLQ